MILLSDGGYSVPFGIVVEDYSAKPAGTYQDTVTFTAQIEKAQKTWNYATISSIDCPATFEQDGISLTTTEIPNPNHEGWTLDSKSGGNFYDYCPNTFRTSSGKFTKIEMISTYANVSGFTGATVTRDGTFYSTQDGMEKDCYKVIWTGSAEEVSFQSDIYAVEQIIFTIE